MALIHVGFFSEVMGMCMSCDVILPQYSRSLIGMQTAETAGPKKVLYLLHGASDDHTIWQRRTSIERYAAPLGLAVVMPAAHLSSYADMVHGQKFYTYISHELPKIMQNFFGFSDKREDNYIAGLSMGGAGCMKIGLANPDKFSAIGCFSAGASNLRKNPNPNPRFAKRQLMVYGDRKLEGTEEDVLGNAKKIVKEKGPFPRIYHACGEDDFLKENAHATRDFFMGFEGNPFDYVYEENPGAHTWEFWDEHIQHFLKYLKLEKTEGVRN